MSKHLSKEELQSDPLIENVQKVTAFFNENRTVILAVLIGVIVIVGSLVGYNFYSSGQEGQAQELLATAEAYYIEGDYARALNGDDFELTYGFLAIANEFSGTDAGNLANYYASVSSFKLGNIEDALAHFENYNPPKGILGVGPLSYYASILKANGSLDKAAETYVKAAEWDENDSTTPYNLQRAADTYFEAGNTEMAGQLADRILTEYAGSAEVTEAQRLTGKIAVN
ncbi:MAG: hypothetical protein JJ895_15120 [Balneolaceae bacterium]|nr:hypothetical protein [Balneolaceae bacterium]